MGVAANTDRTARFALAQVDLLQLATGQVQAHGIQRGDPHRIVAQHITPAEGDRQGFQALAGLADAALHKQAVGEGANMPSTPEAIEVYQKNGVLYGPAKAANAGGVAVSGLEMSQNSYRLSWTFEEVDAKLKSIMEEIVANSLAAAKEYGHEGDLMLGANAAGFVKVANAMVAQGVL